MKRTAIILVWLASLLAAYLLGLRASDEPHRFGPAAGPAERTGLVGAAGERQGGDGRLPLSVAAARIRTDRPGSLAQARALTEEGSPYEAIEVLLEHLARDSHDAEALFLLSDLRQMTGEVDRALEPLIEILRFPPTPVVGERARSRLDLLINAREQQLINGGDMVGLVTFFESLVALEPGFDGHRLKLSRWLARSGEIDAAGRLLKEVGLVGVEPEEIAVLGRELELARTTLAVEQVGGAMFTSVAISGGQRSAEVRFLIDTGATMTGLAEARLEALGAKKVDDGVRVQTANGVALLPVYRISELRVGALVLRDLNVLGFRDLPRGAEGLLGMDVLSGLSGGIPGPVGRP